MTVFAGDIIYAADFVAIDERDKVLNSVSSTSDSSAISTTETVVATLPSYKYLANTAYRLEVRGGVTMSTTTGFSAWAIRKTNASGTVLLQYPRVPVQGNTNAFALPLGVRYFKVGGSDVTTVLVLTLIASAGATATHAGNATYPRGVEIYAAGPSTYQPNAVTLS